MQSLGPKKAEKYVAFIHGYDGGLIFWRPERVQCTENDHSDWISQLGATMEKNDQRDIITILAVLAVTFFVGMRFGETNVPDLNNVEIGGPRPVMMRSQNFMPQQIPGAPQMLTVQNAETLKTSQPASPAPGTDFQPGLIEFLIKQGEKVQAKKLLDGYRASPEIVQKYGALIEQFEKQLNQ